MGTFSVGSEFIEQQRVVTMHGRIDGLNRNVVRVGAVGAIDDAFCSCEVASTKLMCIIASAN